MLERGVSVQTVSAMLGQETTKMTEQRYSHWIKSRLAKMELEVKNAWTNLDQVASTNT